MIDNFSTDFHVRSPMMSELEAVHKLLEVCDVAEYGAPDITLDDLRTVWLALSINLAADAWIVIAPGGRLIGYADVEHRQHVRVSTFIRVLPEYAGQGIEKYLLQLAQDWAQRQISLAKPGVRVTLNSWTSNQNAAAQESFERAGFKEVRRSWRMEIEMQEVPFASDWPEHVTVRTCKPGQHDRAVFAAIDEAFQDHWGYMQGDYEEWRHWTIE